MIFSSGVPLFFLGNERLLHFFALAKLGVLTHELMLRCSSLFSVTRLLHFFALAKLGVLTHEL
ncbi:hypothetical protein BU101_10105 [Staphylococcus shinii]|nr:hypothetical protein BU101_10105 [Staphylococcus shinii]